MRFIICLVAFLATFTASAQEPAPAQRFTFEQLVTMAQSADPGLRAAVYGPAGWLPMGVALLILLTTRLRHEVRTPPVEIVDTRWKVWFVVVPRDSEPPSNPTLH